MSDKKDRKDKEINAEEDQLVAEEEVLETKAGVEDKKSDTSSTAKELENLKDKYIRLYAEFDNYKKRTVKEKLDLMKTAAQRTMEALLPVLDDFDRARKNAEDESTDEYFSEGVELVYHKLYNILRQQGLEPMQTTGEPFDPELHEAFTEIPAPSEDMKGKVVDTIEKGYKLNDKIIRHAKVVVGK